MKDLNVVLICLSCFLVSIVITSWSADWTLVKQCSPTQKHPQAKKLLKDLNWLNFSILKEPLDSLDLMKAANKHKTEDIIFVGHNTYLANCSSYSIPRLLEQVTSTVKKGLSCLTQLGKHRYQDAAILLNFFNNFKSDPLVLRCDLNRNHEYMGEDKKTGIEGSTIGGDASAFICTNNVSDPEPHGC